MGFWDYFSSGSVITDMSALRKAMDKTRKTMEQAKYLEYFRDKSPDCFGKFTQAEKNLKKMSGMLGKVDEVHALAKSTEKIRWVLSILDEEHTLRFDSQRAAIAIGVLLVEFGEISKNLPTPASRYSHFLIAFGGSFTGIVSELTPQTRKKPKSDLGFAWI